jgi:hypothetical protein
VAVHVDVSTLVDDRDRVSESSDADNCREELGEFVRGLPLLDAENEVEIVKDCGLLND